MSNWKGFWSGLNIRKALALVFGLAMIVGSLAIVFVGLGKEAVDKELVSLGLSGIVTLATTLVGYYFGYSNGMSQTDSKKDITDQM